MLDDLDEFVAAARGGLVRVRRLIVRPLDERFGERVASLIDETLADEGRRLRRELGERVDSSGARLVAYSYMRLGLVRPVKPLALFDGEDVLVDGDLDDALSGRTTLSRDAYIVSKKR